MPTKLNRKRNALTRLGERTVKRSGRKMGSMQKELVGQVMLKELKQGIVEGHTTREKIENYYANLGQKKARMIADRIIAEVEKDKK